MTYDRKRADELERRLYDPDAPSGSDIEREAAEVIRAAISRIDDLEEALRTILRFAEPPVSPVRLALYLPGAAEVLLDLETP